MYTDSAYAHGICYLFGSVWKQRGFRRADGSPVRHEDQIKELIAAMMLLSKLAVIKCQAHCKGNEMVDQGNNSADEAAKVASRCQLAVLAPMVSLEPAVTPEDIILMQQEAGVREHNVWTRRGATKNEKGLWRSHDGLLVAPVALLTMLISDVHSVHHCARGEVLKKVKQQGY